ncbi:LysM peptidoglycan-binding domain-containing protein [Atopomonas sediminilitoris]|uniref:LysM peptidoglycan-binding domain-containing protein n=1 Tax=Atopomonas sediminilitoris TaxID=2919919 RepID=UPI001F4E4F81|nr:LysM peptidoglycan-binding domain-containing protein [Atopomonas sediminilitoris]MCJ8169365.1 LysM peptidoglycan-binding domain-containing protein [Atopomonas sediminilitoris]
MRKTLVALMLAAASTLAHAEALLKEGHPQNYTVAKGDTLWDISGKFLTSPWKWPEIWHANPQVKNPHLIYPGDTLSLVYIDGKPQLMLNRGTDRGTIKLVPGVRTTPLAEAIPTIPLDKINAFLLSNRIVNTQAEFDGAPYVLAGNQESVINGVGDTIFARGNFAGADKAMGIFRQGKTYTDPVTNEFLGINADDIGTADKQAVDGDIVTMVLTRTTQETRLGDRLFPTEERGITSIFQPSEPSLPIDGVILDVPRGVTQIGAMDVVTINKGTHDGLAEGNVLAIMKTGETVRDVVTDEFIKVPDQRSGLLMVFRAYDRLSYGLVLRASRQLAVKDRVTNP